MSTEGTNTDFGISRAAHIHLSIVVRTRNEGHSLKQLFEALAAQRCAFGWEVVVVDNESSDDTATICRQYNARVVTIGQADFTYGRALNLGIRHARGELVMLLSAHSLPVGSYFLQAAVAPFDDAAMAAVRCLRSNSGHMTQWYRPIDIQYHSVEEQRLAEAGTHWTTMYPAANGCVIRRAVWEQIPYDEQLEANEDKLWASRVLRNGFKVRCCAEAVYVYTRRRPKWAEWRRHNLDYRSLYRMSGYVPLTWYQYMWRVSRAILLSPLVAGRYVAEALIWNTMLVTVPWQARRSPRAGSLAEFDKST
jgi:glycosyltransferase involved in cell wall biosynthesis